MKPTPIGRYTDTPSYEELQRQVARLLLTDAEREAIELAIATWVCKPQLKATLRGLLERTQ